MSIEWSARGRLAAWVVVLSCAVAANLSAQPARDTPAQAQRGAAATPAGRITGRVVTADTGRPVQRARVRLSAAELPGGRGALTDADGAFDFTELPAGRYTLAVSKSGFVNISYGQRRPLQPGTPLQLNEGQRLQGLEMRLPRGSVIAGQVLDEVGDPLPGASVRVMAHRYTQGSRQLIPVGSAITDDRGAYRVWGLNPGDYYVSAAARNFDVGPWRGFGGAPGGGRGRGGPPRTPNVGGTGLDPTLASESPEQTGYAPTFFPGVESAAEARPISLGLSAEVPDVTFAVLLVRTSRVSGRVASSDGEPVSTGNLVLMREGQSVGRPGAGAGFADRIQWDGTFAFSNVPPGRYLLRVRGDDWDVPRFAMMPLTVTGGELSGVNVVLLPSASIEGTAVFQRTQGLPPDPTQFRVGAPSVDGSNLGSPQNGRVERDGRFTLDGVAAGGHWIRTQSPRGWVVKSIVSEGRDITDTPIELRSGQRLTGLTVTFTDKLSEINGHVRDTRGTPITEYTILAFPVESSLWYPESRFVMTARPDQTGEYRIRGLPAGAYFVGTVDPAEANEWFEPSFLEEQRANAVRLTLSEGDVKTHNVVLGR
jgi:hypothetical protein